MKTIEKECVVCGKTYSTSRSHSKTCSVTCRVELSNKNRLLKELAPKNVLKPTESLMDMIIRQLEIELGDKDDKKKIG